MIYQRNWNGSILRVLSLAALLSYCYSANTTTPESPTCRVAINEINVIDPKKPENAEFIELRSFCGDMALRGYKLIGIVAGEKGATIELVVQLWNERFPASGLFTVGGSAVSGASMKIPNIYIKFRYQTRRGDPIMSNFLNNGQNKLNAIALVYSDNPTALDVINLNNRNHLVLTDELIEIIKIHLVDMVVYSKLNDRDRCNIYDQLCPELVGRKYTLRELPTQNPENSDLDITLNRCAEENRPFYQKNLGFAKKHPMNQMIVQGLI